MSLGPGGKPMAGAGATVAMRALGLAAIAGVFGAVEFAVIQERVSVVGFVLAIMLFGLLCPPKHSAGLMGLLAAANLNALPFVPVRYGVVQEIPLAALLLAVGMIAQGGRRVRIAPQWIKPWAAGMALLAFIGIARPQLAGAVSSVGDMIEVSQPFTVPFCCSIVFAVALSRDSVWKTAGAVLFSVLAVNSLLRVGLFVIGDPTALIRQVFHPTVLRTVVGELYDANHPGGAVRIVAPFNRMIPWAWAISLALVFTTDARWRRQSFALLLLFSTVIYLNYGRQMYLGLIVTSVFAVVFAGRFSDGDGALGRISATQVRTAAIAAGGALIAVAMATSGAGTNRLEQVFSIGSADDRTSMIRLRALNWLLNYLHGTDDWIFGKGFRTLADVGSRTVAAAGGLYNPDLGLIAVLMPLGLVGVAALLVGVAGLVRSSMAGLHAVQRSPAHDQVVLQVALAGSALYFVFFLAVSTSLFLSQSACLGVALAFAIGIAAISEANEVSATASLEPNEQAPLGRFGA